MKNRRSMLLSVHGRARAAYWRECQEIGSLLVKFRKLAGMHVPVHRKVVLSTSLPHSFKETPIANVRSS